MPEAHPADESSIPWLPLGATEPAPVFVFLDLCGIFGDRCGSLNGLESFSVVVACCTEWTRIVFVFYFWGVVVWVGGASE